MYPFRVRAFHVDRQNVVHQIWYFFFLEEARLEFLRELGMKMDDQTFISHSKYFVVQNTCNYFESAVFDDVLDIYSRISFVKNSSLGFEHIMVNRRTGNRAITGTQVTVHVNVETNKPTRIPQDFRAKILRFEGAACKFIDP